MKAFLNLIGLSVLALFLNSCVVASVATLPLKVAHDVVQGTYNVGKGVTKSIANGGRGPQYQY